MSPTARKTHAATRVNRLVSTAAPSGFAAVYPEMFRVDPDRSVTDGIPAIDADPSHSDRFGSRANSSCSIARLWLSMASSSEASYSAADRSISSLVAWSVYCSIAFIEWRCASINAFIVVHASKSSLTPAFTSPRCDMDNRCGPDLLNPSPDRRIGTS